MPAARYLADLAGTGRSQFRIKPDAAAGPPTSGYHKIGTLHMDATGVLWSCTATGTPGSWVALAPVDPPVGGQVVLPAALTVLDTLDITLYRTAKWALELRKGTKLWVEEILASHDGTTPTDVRPASFKIGTGPVDADGEVDISGGLLRLTVTPGSTGWTATWRRLYALGA